jgi:hypothetical protein
VVAVVLKRFDKLWRVVTAAAGMKQRLLVHDLRRTATRNMLEAGMTKEDIKGLTRHDLEERRPLF